MGAAATFPTFDHHCGDKRTLEFTVRDDVTGGVVDLSAFAGTDLTWNFAKNDTNQSPSPKGAAVLGTAKSIGSGITITDGPNGVCQVTMDEADTADQKPHIEYYHELRAVVSSNVATASIGIFNMKEALLKP